uniref:Uncharacterized protein n=1 Tax=Rhizophagus irregularis (strain DAOM 181602 / DAOM 197198 / MUCL 43194) TaxID=747089 RepID=U9STF7_RHIID
MDCNTEKKIFTFNFVIFIYKLGNNKINFLDHETSNSLTRYSMEFLRHGVLLLLEKFATCMTCQSPIN